MVKKVTFLANDAKFLEVLLDTEKKSINNKNVICKRLSEMILNNDVDMLSYGLIERRLRYFLRTDLDLTDILLEIENKGFITAKEPNLRVRVE